MTCTQHPCDKGYKDCCEHRDDTTLPTHLRYPHSYDWVEDEEE